MADHSKIEWTDATWNVVIGCDKVSPGCDRCYAIRTAHRMQANPNEKIAAAYAGTEADGEWTGTVNLIEDRLDLPLRWSKPRRIFVNAQSDLFHDQVPDEFIAHVWAVMALAQQHTFQILTKRHGRMRSLLTSPHFEAKVQHHVVRETGAKTEWPVPNVWLGVSVEDQKRADLRVPALLRTPTAVRFLSCEPLLGPVDLRRYLDPERDCTCRVPAMEGAGQHAATCPCLTQPELHWVIAGGESGRGARPMSPAWARTLRDQCTEAGVAFHFKQWGDAAMWTDRQGDAWTLGSDGLLHTPETAPFTREHVEKKWGPLKNVSKRAAGRELDGRTWDEFPEAAVTV